MTHLIFMKIRVVVYFIYLIHRVKKNIDLQVKKIMFCNAFAGQRLDINKNKNVKTISIGPGQFHHAFLNPFEPVCGSEIPAERLQSRHF